MQGSNQMTATITQIVLISITMLFMTFNNLPYIAACHEGVEVARKRFRRSRFDSRHTLTEYGPSDAEEAKDVFRRAGDRVNVLQGLARQKPPSAIACM